MNKSIKGIITFPAGQISAGVHLLLCQISFHLIPSFLKVLGDFMCVLRCCTFGTTSMVTKLCMHVNF